QPTPRPQVLDRLVAAQGEGGHVLRASHVVQRIVELVGVLDQQLHHPVQLLAFRLDHVASFFLLRRAARFGWAALNSATSTWAWAYTFAACSGLKQASGAEV